MMAEPRQQLVTDIDPRAFFLEAVHSAVLNQQLNVCGETIVYLGNLLTSFINTDRLYEQTTDGVMLKPLAQYYLQAVEAGSIHDRIKALRRMGDISLFISGLYAQSLSRSLVDIDYYISMGGNAYGYLSDSGSRSAAVGLRNVFAELSAKFVGMVDVLSEVGEVTSISSNHDILRLYEVWMKSGSKRSAQKLRQAGIEPVKSSNNRH